MLISRSPRRGRPLTPLLPQHNAATTNHSTDTVLPSAGHGPPAPPKTFANTMSTFPGSSEHSADIITLPSGKWGGGGGGRVEAFTKVF